MHENNKIRNPHDQPTKLAEIVLTFEVPQAEATEEWMNAVVGIISREVAADLGKSAQVKGKWL